MNTLGSVLCIIGGILAVPGWLLNRPNTETRYEVRMYAWIALTGANFCWGTANYLTRNWFLVVVALLAVFGGMTEIAKSLAQGRDDPRVQTGAEAEADVAAMTWATWTAAFLSGAAIGFITGWHWRKR